MPRVVRMGRRRKIKDRFKVDKKCRIGRTYQDYLKFRQEHPDLPVVEMDTVEGRIGGKVLLTLHFTFPQLMLAFIRDANTSQSVIDIFDRLYLELYILEEDKNSPNNSSNKKVTFLMSSPAFSLDRKKSFVSWSYCSSVIR